MGHKRTWLGLVVLVLCVGVAYPVLAQSDPEPAFVAGDRVVVQVPVVLQSQPGPGRPVLTTLPELVVLTITTGPRMRDGAAWWRVRDDYGQGWVPATVDGVPALALYEDGSLEAALQAAADRLAAQPEDVEALLRQGMAAYGLKRYADAQADFDAAAILAPQDARVAFYQGLVAMQQGVDASARDAFERAWRLDPDFLAAPMQLSNLLTDVDPYRAIAVCQTPLVLQPTFVSCINNTANAYRNLYDYDAALETYTRGMSIDPDDAFIYRNRGLMYQDLGDDRSALADFAAAMAVDPSYAPSFSARGALYLEQGRYNEALDDLNHAIQLDPTWGWGFFQRGVVRAELGQYGPAAEDFQQATELLPDLASARYNLGLCLGNLGRVDEAIASYTQAIELDPTYLAAYFNRSRLYTDLEEYQAALADLDRSLELNVAFTRAYLQRALVYDALGETEAALDDLTTGLRYNPPNAYLFYYNRAFIRFNRGGRSVDLVIADYQAAIQLNPTYADAYLGLGHALKVSGRAAEALDAYQTYLSLTTNPYPAIADMVAELQQELGTLTP